jgi:hypothetical protein
MSFFDRLQHGWNAFMNKDPTADNYIDSGMVSYIRPDRPVLRQSSQMSIIGPIMNRIAVDAASMKILHVRLDDEGRYSDTINSGLNNCLTLEANIDQTGRDLIYDAILSMLDEGCVAIVPIDTSIAPKEEGGPIDILTMRTGKIIEWYPQKVKVSVYNDKTGQHQEIIVPKKIACIVENPFYAIMNAPNSVAHRLIHKLNLLDIIDEQTGSNKMNLIIQLPYIIKTKARRQQAEKRRQEIENQLATSKFGIAYTDGTEKITQLNRSVDNNLMEQVEYLTSMLMSQLGLTAEIMNGTADENTMNNYIHRVIEPIVSEIVDEMKRKFLTKTARSQGQSIAFFREPFKLTPISSIAEIADKFTRNEIMTSNEVRQIVGLKPSQNPSADELRNKNISKKNDAMAPTEEIVEDGGIIQNEEL